MLAFYQTVIVVESSDSAHLRLRRLQPAGPAFRELHSCTSDMEVVVVQPQRHVFMRVDRKELIAFGTTFGGAVSHLFLSPAPFATFRRLHWYEYHQVQMATYVFFVVFYLATIVIWAFFATPTLLPLPTWVGGQDETGGLCLGSKCSSFYHDNALEEMPSWVMIASCLLNFVFLLSAPFVLRRHVKSGAIEEWHRSGPPRNLRISLCIPVASIVLTKGLMAMVIWIHIKAQPRDANAPYSRTEQPWLMWSGPERFLATVVVVISLGYFKWLDSWQLIGFRW